MSGCPWTPGELTSRALANVITQYRESKNFLAYLTIFLDQLEEVGAVFCDIQGAFDPDTAEDDQLDMLGKMAGFPRCHCGGIKKVYFGLVCGTCGFDPGTVEGFCTGEWPCAADGEAITDYEDFCFTDDDQYRSFIKAKIIKNRSNGNAADLTESLGILFGADARILWERNATLAVGTGRVLTSQEKRIIHLFASVLPIIRGVRLEIYEVTQPFGFGAGWFGLCDGEFGHRVY